EERGRVLVEPGRMPELERGLDAARQRRQEVAQPGQIRLEMWGELEEQGATRGAERFAATDELARRLRGILEPQAVWDLLRGLECEAERLRSLRRPAAQQRGRRHAIEGVVDLDGTEHAGVERQHAARGLLLGVEGSAPGGITEARRADEELGRVRRAGRHGFSRESRR